MKLKDDDEIISKVSCKIEEKRLNSKKKTYKQTKNKTTITRY